MKPIKKLFLLAIIVAVHPVFAKTLELWPLGAGATPGTLNLSPTVNSSHKLNVYTASGTFTPFAPAFSGVPGNQSETTERNMSAIGTFDASRALLCSSDDIRTAARLVNDFTIEGWFKLDENTGMWLLGTRAKDGWYLRYANGEFMFHCGSDNTVAKCDASVLRENWTHLAFVWHHEGGDNGFGYCELFINHELVATKAPSAAPTTTAKDQFYIGGRGNTGYDQYKGGKFAVDCVRFSDTALGPDDFLKATTCPQDEYPAVDNPDLVGFWRMDEGAKLVNAVAGGPSISDALNSSVLNTDDSSVSRIPNMEWSVCSNVKDNFDHGSVKLGSATSGNRLYVSGGNGGVSKYLSLTNDFTLEGWIKVPRELPSSWAVMTGVHTTTSPRWWLIIRNNYYYIMVQKSDNNYTVADNKGFEKDGVTYKLKSEDVGKWRHHAIVFEKNKGTYGTFSLYIDGEYKGSRAQTAAYPSADSKKLAGYSFDLGGRESAGNCFNGLGINLVRITKKALQPSEFLNAESACHPPAAESVTNAVVTTKTTLLVTNALETSTFVSCDRPFTVEGWVRVSKDAVYPQRLAECKTGSGGWTLTAANSHEVMLQVANGDGASLVEKSFTLADDDLTWWKHLEVTHSFGLWSVYINTNFVGSATGDVPFKGVDNSPVLTLGSDSGKVTHEKWRIVNNALSAGFFDYVERLRQGLIIVFQ